MGCFGVIARLIFLIFVSGCLGIAAAVGASAFLRSSEAAPLIGVVVAALVFLYNLRSVFRTRKCKQVIATIVQVWVQAPPGAPWYYWTYVLFESRGERIEVHLTKQQAKAFRAQMGEGDTGYLKFSGDRLISWHVASASSPLPAMNQVSVFLSYSHGWSNEAAYISQVFQTYGISVWRDVEQLHTGDQLNKKIIDQIQAADYFVPLLSPEYFASSWCVKELEVAARGKVKVIPIKVSMGSLVFPPHLRRLYEQDLAEPLFLDIRGKNPAHQLKELAQRMM